VRRPGWSKGMRMEAQRAKTLGLCSRQPAPKGMPQ